jgi:hypothetical protein
MNIPLLVGTGFALFGLYMFKYALASYQKAIASLNWPCIDGKLVKVHLWGRRNVDGEMKEVRNLDVAYNYKVLEKEFSGNAVTFYTLVFPETTEFATRHPVNSTIPVYYNPADPAESVLIPGTRPGNKRYSDIILAIIGVITGIAIAVSGWLGILG